MNKKISVKMNTDKKRLVPPDGGWGWMIVLASATNLTCTLPIIQGFGLLFRDRCADLGMTGIEISIIITVNSAFGMGLGLINGPLLRRFGCRRIAIAGAVFHTVGLMLSAWANSFTLFIITYGILCSLGSSIMNSAFSLSLNSYFSIRRGRAVGFALTLTGLGQILAPQLISFMMPRFGVTGTVAVLGAISLHTWAAALLLQPLEWHLKEDVSDVEMAKIEDNYTEDEKTRKQSLGTSFEELKTPRRRRTLTESSMDQDFDTENVYGLDTLAPRIRSFNTVGSDAGRTYRRSYSQQDAQPPTPTLKEPPKISYKWWEPAISIETINLGSSMKIFDESRSGKRTTFGNDDEQKVGESHVLLQKTVVPTVEEEEEDGEDDKRPDNQKKDEPRKKKSILAAVITFFDFDLLRDPTYVNIMMGMSIAVFAELNFSVLTPFMLSDMSFDTDQIATVLSCLAITDLLLRGISPFIGEWINQPARVMYLFSLILLVAARTGLIFARSYTSVILVGFALGVAKGIRTVYMTMVIASYVPIERLASATGLQMATNGIILLVVGPIIGIIRDKSGSYSLCIIFLNMMTTFTILMWTIDIIVGKIRGTTNREEEK